MQLTLSNPSKTLMSLTCMWLSTLVLCKGIRKRTRQRTQHMLSPFSSKLRGSGYGRIVQGDSSTGNYVVQLLYHLTKNGLFFSTHFWSFHMKKARCHCYVSHWTHSLMQSAQSDSWFHVACSPSQMEVAGRRRHPLWPLKPCLCKFNEDISFFLMPWETCNQVICGNIILEDFSCRICNLHGQQN